MRNINELLIILRKEVDDNLVSGMCVSINCLLTRIDFNGKGIVTCEECNMLRFYLRSNKPTGIEIGVYWFKIGLKQPRLNWLDEHINLTK